MTFENIYIHYFQSLKKIFANYEEIYIWNGKKITKEWYFNQFLTDWMSTLYMHGKKNLRKNNTFYFLSDLFLYFTWLFFYFISSSACFNSNLLMLQIVMRISNVFSSIYCTFNSQLIRSDLVSWFTFGSCRRRTEIAMIK